MSTKLGSKPEYLGTGFITPWKNDKMNNGAFCLSSTYIYGELPGGSANEMSLWETSKLGDLKTLNIKYHALGV